MPQIVLADDNVTTQRVFELSLAEDEGIELNCQESAEAAWDLIQQSPPDLLYVHVDLPEGGGYELSRRVKSSRQSAEVTVVMLVGAFQNFDAQKAARAGCLHHLAKPFETSTLLGQIRSLLENPPGILLPQSRFLFQIPQENSQAPLVFELSQSQCHPRLAELGREVKSPEVPDFQRPASRPVTGFEAAEAGGISPKSSN